jgi:hypothetical protein
VPKAAINKNGEALAREKEIWSAGDFGDVHLPAGQASANQHTPQSLLR